MTNGKDMLIPRSEESPLDGFARGLPPFRGKQAGIKQLGKLHIYELVRGTLSELI